MALGIVKAHRGGITVASAPGQGSSFCVFFPSSNELAIPRLPAPAARVTSSQGGAALLVVEDEDVVRIMTGAMLTRLGYTVFEARDGVEAVEVFKQHPSEIMGVLCDLVMPRMNGWDTLNALRAMAPGLPVILASGYDEDQVMAGEHPELPQVCLGKPYQMQQLRAALDRALKPGAAARSG